MNRVSATARTNINTTATAEIKQGTGKANLYLNPSVSASVRHILTSAINKTYLTLSMKHSSVIAYGNAKTNAEAKCSHIRPIANGNAICNVSATADIYCKAHASGSYIQIESNFILADGSIFVLADGSIFNTLD